MQQMYEREHVMTDALQGTVESTGQDHGTFTCSNCAGHRLALVNQSVFNAQNSSAAMAMHVEIRELADKCKEDLNAALLQNGMLCARLMRNTDPFWKSREVIRMKDEHERVKVQLQTLEAECSALKQENGLFGEIEIREGCFLEQFKAAQETIHRLELEKLGIEQGKAFELDQVLMRNFENAFIIHEGNEEV